MKNTICIALFSVLFNTSFAQKCKEVVDPITNEKKVEFVSTDASGYGSVQYEAKNGSATLTKQFYYTGALNTIAPSGIEIFFKLENGDIVKLKTIAETSPKMYAGMGVITGYNFVMSITKEDLNKLAASPVTLIRIPKVTETGFYDLDKKNWAVKKSKKGLQKGAACMGTF